MNEQAKRYWDAFWQHKEPPERVSAEQFGFEAYADELAQLIIDRKKTATCSAHVLYELENEPLPAVGMYTIVLNSQDNPVAIIKTSKVEIIKMSDVPEDLAIAEGEGDLTYNYWWDAHQKHFTMELGQHGLAFSKDMLLVFERFELVDVKQEPEFDSRELYDTN